MAPPAWLASAAFRGADKQIETTACTYSYRNLGVVCARSLLVRPLPSRSRLLPVRTGWQVIETPHLLPIKAGLSECALSQGLACNSERAGRAGPGLITRYNVVGEESRTSSEESVSR